jgi:hypothetical protein
MTFAIVASPGPRGSTLALLAARAPGYDLSTNRVDKHVRDELIRTAPAHFLTALIDQLDGAHTGRVLEVAAG